MRVLIFSSAILMAVAVAPNADAADRRIDGDSRIGCKSRDYYEKLVGFAASDDMDAFKQGLVQGVATDECTMFQAGAAVIVEDTAIFSGLMKIRVRGDTASYWTALESAR